MNSTALKIEIEEKIEEINDSFPSYWTKSFYNKVIENDIDTLNSLLVKVKSWFRVSIIILILEVGAIIGILIFKNLKGVYFVENTPIGIFLLNLAVILRMSFKQYAVKHDLKTKIFLLNLLNKLE